MPQAGLRRLIDALPLLVALTIAIAAPLGFIGEALRDEQHTLQFKAGLGATRVARYIYTHASMWQYHGLRIAEVIQLPEAYAVRQTVRDADGRMVVEDGPERAGPALRATAPIVVDGTRAGSFEAASGLWPVLLPALRESAASWLLAALAFVAIRELPIRALNRALDRLAWQTHRFEAALDNMSQGLCMLDARQRIVVANRHLLEMFALDGAAALLGRPAADAADTLMREGGMSRALCERILLPPAAEAAGGQAGHGVAELPDGRVLNIERRRMAGGGWLTTVQDVTDRQRAERAERRAAQQRERARHEQEMNQAKSMFLATMSHEIRTPMNGVLGLASSLLDGELTAEQRLVVETIRESGDGLMQILNDILEFSRLEANALVLEALPFSPAGLAGGVAGVLGLRARAQGLRMRVTTDPGLPEAVRGDAGRLRQVLMNLVGNAIKFTRHGEIEVTTRRLAPGADGAAPGSAALEWEVRDTGIGIAPEVLGELFREFTQADGSINRRFGGSGLGLAICRRLVDRMGGTIAAESAPGSGSVFRFRVTLPLADAAALAQAPRRDGVAELKSWLGRLGRRCRVLAAEDNATNRFVLERMLTGLGIDFDLVPDGVQAVSAAARRHYDAICMDCQMPEMDGLEAAQAIRAEGGWRATVPIIALTGNAFAESRQACRDAGMDFFLAKPISTQGLAEMLLHALAPEAAAGSARPPAAAEAEPEGAIG